MPSGFVSTARGQMLNMDELIAKGSRPVEPVAKSTSETTHYKPQTAKPQVRGFVPVQGSVMLNQSEVAPVPEIK